MIVSSTKNWFNFEFVLRIQLDCVTPCMCCFQLNISEKDNGRKIPHRFGLRNCTYTEVKFIRQLCKVPTSKIQLGFGASYFVYVSFILINLNLLLTIIWDLRYFRVLIYLFSYGT
jgi:hypothetical protein